MRLIRGLIACWLCVVLAAFAIACVLESRPLVRQFTLDPMRIGALAENAYAVVIPPAPGAPLLSWNADDYTIHRSALRMFEDGAALPVPHASQLTVQRRGLGRYIHLGDTAVYFSTTDNSDPRMNGRTYSVRAVASPRVGLTFGLFIAATALTVLLLATGAGHGRRISAAIPQGAVWVPALFVLIATAWLARIWSPAPFIVEIGDAGNVASIAAGWLFRESFAGDLVLQDALQSTFYLALSIPFTMAMTSFTGDVGQAYVLLTVPILVLQMYGFFLLGQRLFSHKGWSVLLALVSVPPVYVFGGELWGNLWMPLTRAAFGALLPYVLLVGLSDDRDNAYRPFAAMALCGVGVYLHPVSAPSVALACWLALACDRPETLSRSRYALRMIAAGMVFVLLALPFGFTFFSVFPTIADGESARVATQALRRAAGDQFFEAIDVARRVITGGDLGWGWRWLVWIMGLGGLLLLPWRHPRTTRNVRFIGVFLLGIVAASVGIAWLDQTIAAHLDRQPTQIDLVRNVRFVVPVLLTAAVYWLAVEFRASRGGTLRSSSLAAIGITLLLLWCYRHPTPPTLALNEWLGAGVPADSIRAADRQIIVEVARLAPGSIVLPLPAAGAETKVELIGLAVRYAARRPVAFLGKDLNLLSYSSSSRVADWLATEADLRRLDEPGILYGEAALARVVDRHRISHLLLHVPSASSALLAHVERFARGIAESGEWRLLEIHAGP